MLLRAGHDADPARDRSVPFVEGLARFAAVGLGRSRMPSFARGSRPAMGHGDHEYIRLAIMRGLQHRINMDLWKPAEAFLAALLPHRR